MAKPENPPAFPTDGRIQHGTPYDGMSLRDWFAGQALPAVIAATSAGQHDLCGTGSVVEQLAQEAYRLADAMLVARENTDG